MQQERNKRQEKERERQINCVRQTEGSNKKGYTRLDREKARDRKVRQSGKWKGEGQENEEQTEKCEGTGSRLGISDRGKTEKKQAKKLSGRMLKIVRYCPELEVRVNSVSLSQLTHIRVSDLYTLGSNLSCAKGGLSESHGDAVWRPSNYTGWRSDCMLFLNLLWTRKGITYCTHSKPSPFGKQFCQANTAIIPSYITFQNNQKKIFHPKQM